MEFDRGAFLRQSKRNCGEVTQTETVNPSGFLVQSVTFNLPEDLTGADPSGEFVVDITIDPTNTLSETNDNDNTTSLTIKIVAPPPEPPNLVPTLVSSDPGLDGDALAPGQTVSLNWSVENSSPTALAAPWNSTVVLKSQSGDVLQTVANVTKFGPTGQRRPSIAVGHVRAADGVGRTAIRR